MRRETPHFYEFGPFRLDPSTPFLLREGRPVALTLKALETLVVLIERGGRVVSRQELIEAVWPDTVVEENNLSVNVSMLRKVLGEGEGGEKYIETVPRRGYRFTAAVRNVPVESVELIYTRQTRSQTLVEESSEEDAQAFTVASDSALDETPKASHTQAIVIKPAPSSSRLRRLARWPVLLAIAVTIAAIAAGVAIVRRGWQRDNDSISKGRGAAVNGAGGMSIRSLAVLLFKEGSGTYNFGQYSGGEHTELTDALVARLGETGNVILASQDALLAEKATPNNILIAGRALKVDAVLTGAIYLDNAEGVRLRLHLVSVNGGEVLWADTLGCRRSDLPKMLDSIAHSVLAGLQRLRSAEEYERHALRYTENREAYQHYLQGRFLWNQRSDVFAANYVQWLKDNIASVNQLEQARALDPNFALAYVGLADHYKAGDYSSSEWRRAEDYALRAIALAPDLAEAHATLGFIRMLHYWDWTGAEVEFNRALELNPDCITAHQWYALFHALRGNGTESIKEIARAGELAPYSLAILIDAARMQYYAAEVTPQMTISDTIGPLLHVLELHRNASNARELLTYVYWMSGEYERAIAVAGSDWKGKPQDYARHRAGPRKGTREFADTPDAVTYQRAMWHAQLNQREEALDLLERAHRYHHFFIIYIKADPFFKNLHDEPRYQELLRKVGLF